MSIARICVVPSFLSAILVRINQDLDRSRAILVRINRAPFQVRFDPTFPLRNPTQDAADPGSTLQKFTWVSLKS